MILTGPEIVKEIEKGSIQINPFDKNRVNPNSYNLSLHKDLLVYTQLPLDMKADNPTSSITMDESGYVLEPGKLYLGRTNEFTVTEGYVPMLEGRSSVGRLGLYIHVTAGFGDTGFSGYWTLEIQCIHPIRIYPNVEICQIFYHEPRGEIVPYQSKKYQNNKEVQASKLWMDF